MIARNICTAVAEIHSMKMVHGDLSSENFMIHPENFDVKLIDFDCSKRFGEEHYA